MSRVGLTAAQIGTPLVAAVGVVMSFSWPGLAVSLILFVLMGGLGMSVIYHRYLAHRAFAPRPVWKWAGLLFGYIGSLMAPIDWAAQHWLHHRYVDAEGDPHAPVRLGWRAAFYGYHGSDKPVPKMVVGRLLRDPAVACVQRYGLAIAGVYVAALALISFEALLYGWVVPAALTHLGQAVAVFNHWPNGPRQCGALNGLLTMGEHSHQAHHQNPRDISGDGIARWIVWLIEDRPRTADPRKPRSPHPPAP